MILFQIGALDITPFIVVSSYAVSSQSEYETWYDGNNTERRAVKRFKLRGSFSVKFFNTSDYQSFLSAVETAKGDGDYLYATVYDNKKRTTKATNVYFDYEPTNVEPVIGWADNEEIEITITER